ncbi:MAG: cupredoxin domain-containing protein [Nitrososphaera sp.]
MTLSIGMPVIAGLSSGIALILVFSLSSTSSPDHGTKEISVVLIPEGASHESNPPFLVPDVIKVKLDVNNTVRWVSQDTVPHALISDSGYVDPLTGVAFDTRQSSELRGGFLMPGDSYEFTFRETGEFRYHGEPHPWMQGTVIVLPP